MNKYITLGCLSAFLYTSTTMAEFRAELTTKTVTYSAPIYVSRSAPILTEVATIPLGTMNAWTWWNLSGGEVRPGIYLPGSFNASSPRVNGAYVKELNNSGIGYTLHGTISGSCSGSAYVDGQQNIDGNYSNRLICSSNATSGNYSVTLEMKLYKLRDNVKSQTIPGIWAAMLIVYNNGFITSDYTGKTEPRINLSPLTIISSGCDVMNNNINVPLGAVPKSSFNGVGSVSPESIKDFNIDLSCDPISPIKIRFDGVADSQQTSGTIGLSNPTDSNTAKGYGIQIKYQNQPIKLGQLITVSEKNSSSGSYSIPLEAGYIQTSDTTSAGKANGTLQFTMQYH